MELLLFGERENIVLYIWIYNMNASIYTTRELFRKCKYEFHIQLKETIKVMLLFSHLFFFFLLVFWLSIAYLHVQRPDINQ